MLHGTIKKIVADRGFGFIAGDRQDVFFHHSTVENHEFEALQEGQSVEYEIDADNRGGGGKGPRASVVRPA